MLKRFYSKRSGFTLVEIIVAFAVFAVMAAMVGQVLQLSISARNSNNAYARTLAAQEQFLTVVEKDKSMFTDTDGSFNLKFDEGTEMDIPYTMASADDEFAGANSGEGLNFFVAAIDYDVAGAEGAGSGSGSSSSSFNTGSQAARYDTRITGTAGLGYIQFNYVGEEEFEEPRYLNPDEPDPDKRIPNPFWYDKTKYTRYLFEVQAATSDKEGQKTFKDENGPYAQFRLYFYESSPNDPPALSHLTDGIDMVASKEKLTDASGNVYTREVYAPATIFKVGYLNAEISTIQSEGLIGNTSNDVNANNIFWVEQMNDFSVRIGTPFDTYPRFSGPMANVLGGTMGYLFSGQPIRFYIDFVGHPEISAASFGHAGEDSGDGGMYYTAAPVYKDEFNADGTPTYNDTGEDHVNIYGAFINKRTYTGETGEPTGE